MRVQAVGMAWYKPEHYQRLKAMFEDGQRLPTTYGAWLAAAEIGRRELETKGLRVMCVDIDPDEFMSWCAASERPLNAASRQTFASQAAHRSITEERRL